MLAQPCDCAADDPSHYDVTSKPVCEVLMAAKIRHQESFTSDNCSKNLKDSDQRTAGIKYPINIVAKNPLFFKKLMSEGAKTSTISRSLNGKRD